MNTNEHGIRDSWSFPVTPIDDETPSLPRAGGIAVLLAVAANAALYVLGSLVGLFPHNVFAPGTHTPIGLANVIGDTTLGVGGAVAVLAVVRRYARDPQPTFRRIAYGVLAFSYTQPVLVLRDAPVRMLIGLDVLHTVAAAIVVWALRDVGRTIA